MHMDPGQCCWGTRFENNLYAYLYIKVGSHRVKTCTLINFVSTKKKLGLLIFGLEGKKMNYVYTGKFVWHFFWDNWKNFINTKITPHLLSIHNQERKRKEKKKNPKTDTDISFCLLQQQQLTHEQETKEHKELDTYSVTMPSGKTRCAACLPLSSQNR